MIRSRRADPSRDQPLYARMLRLRYLSPSGFLCFVFLEGAVALGFLLALAELVSWWGVLVLPITVAAMVKLNDVVAGALSRPAVAAASAPVVAPSAAPVLRPATVRQGASQETVRLPVQGEDLSLPGARTVDLRTVRHVPVRTAIDASALNSPPPPRQWADELDLREQRARQSAARRYE
jgi:hypothetical protein